MTPRENMKRALEFRNPERLPIKGYGELSDGVSISTIDIKPDSVKDEPNVDQWLCRWEQTPQHNMGQVKVHPLEDLSQMASYPWPDANDPRRYATIKSQLDALDADPALRDTYRTNGQFMLLWERMHTLHGFENCMMDIMDDKPEIHELADRIVDYNIALLRNLHRLAGDRIDAFFSSDDWGTEIAPMISPELFRSFFFPRYQKMFRTIREECGWHVWLHSCGKINNLIPQLIEAGVTALNLQQPLVNGIDELGHAFAGKVTFETMCDIQRTLPKGDPDEIAAQASKLMRAWGTPAGGFVLGNYGDYLAFGANPATEQVMLNFFRQSDPWKHSPSTQTPSA